MDIKYKRLFRRTVVALLILGLFSAIAVFAIDSYVRNYGAPYILSAEEAPQADAVMVLGSLVYSGGHPSLILKDRLLTAFDVYQLQKAPKILVSGDHGRVEYDEVNAMKSYLMDRGVADADVFMDHAGFSTYESMYRARDVFIAESLIVSTQRYHLYRALYIARKLGLEAWGVAADRQDYGSMIIGCEIREVLARVKAFLYVEILKPQPTYLGDAIPVTGDGRATNDK